MRSVLVACQGSERRLPAPLRDFLGTFHGVDLLRGFSTRSLPRRAGNAYLTFFNIDWDIPDSLEEAGDQLVTFIRLPES